MKRVIVIGSIALWLGYIAGAAFLSVFAGPRSASGLGVLLTSGTTVAVVISALTLGQILANPADPATAAGRRFYRRLAWVFIGAISISILITIIGGIIRQAPPWVPTAIAALTILCSVGPVAAAERYRRHLPSTTPTAEDWRIGADDRARTFRRVGITLVIATAVTASTLAILSGTTDFGYPGILEIVLASLGVGAIAAGVPTLAAAWRLTTSTNLIFGSDLEGRTAVTHVVVRGKSRDLTAEQELMAAELAHVWREYIPIQTAQAALLIAGLVFINSPRVIRGDTEPWLVATYALLGVGLILAIISGRRQYRSVRRYSEAHPLRAAATSERDD